MKQFAKIVAAVVVGILIAFFLIKEYLAHKVSTAVEQAKQEIKVQEEQEAAAQQQEAAQIRNLDFFPDRKN